MSSRYYIPINLSLPDEPPEQDEIDAILMATDAVISTAGRAGVILILNGSKSQKPCAGSGTNYPNTAH